MFRLKLLLLFFLIKGVFAMAQLADEQPIERFSFHAQTTVIKQFKPSFTAPYSGDNSLITSGERKTSITSTLYLGARLWKGASLVFNPEIAGGSGLSGALGIAAATNGETFRIGDPAPQIYLARLFFKQIFALTAEKSYQASDFNKLGGYLPNKYLSLTIGKIGVADYFDDNRYSHNPRTQFMSWALMDNGAWDYPANTRGYIPSLILEYITPKDEIRYGLSMVALSANGNEINWNLFKARSQSLEYTHRFELNSHKGAIRLLGFYTSANMGNYRQSIALNPQNPSIIDTRKYGNTKLGFGLNIDQELSPVLGFFFRAGWNDGKNETWAFTEIDRTVSAGLSLSGVRWKRKNDNLGFALVSCGLSAPHQDYLAAGGKGFILGDGNLNYAWEKLTEIYYSAELVKNHVYFSGAYQFVLDPGYNKDRKGPINVFSIRLHARI